MCTAATDRLESCRSCCWDWAASAFWQGDTITNAPARLEAEKGRPSFEEQIDATPVDRYVAGWSIQQGERVPNDGQVSLAQARVMAMLSGDDSVLAARAMPTVGLYAGATEFSFDTEWTARREGHDPAMAMAEIARIAHEAGALMHSDGVQAAVAFDEVNDELAALRIGGAG